MVDKAPRSAVRQIELIGISKKRKSRSGSLPEAVKPPGRGGRSTDTSPLLAVQVVQRGTVLLRGRHSGLELRDDRIGSAAGRR